MVARRYRTGPPPRTMVPSPEKAARCYGRGGRTSHGRTGDPHPGANRDERGGEPSAEPDSSPRRPDGLLRGTRAPPVAPPDIGAPARGRAQPRPRHRRVGRGRRHRGPGHDAPPDDRATRRSRSDRACCARGGAVHRQPPRSIRRPGRSSIAPTARADPRSRRRIAPSSRGLRRCAGHDRCLGRLLAEPVTEQPVLPAPVGNDVPVPDPRAYRRLPRLRPSSSGRHRGAGRRHRGRSDRWRDDGGHGRPGRPRLRPRLHRTPLPRNRAATVLLCARFVPGAARASDPDARSPSPRASTAAG